MHAFQYRVTLISGAVAIADNGLQLDRLIRDRWEQVKSIEIIPYGSAFPLNEEESVEDGETVE